MKVVVTGANGLAGSHVARELRSRQHEVVAWGREVDINTAAFASRLEVVRPEAVVNCAAWAGADAAEDQPSAAFRANEAGAGNVAQASFVVGAKLIHLSTNFVYPDSEYTAGETQPEFPPPGVYARSKWAGDALVLARDPRNVVLRTQSIYGAGGRNHVSGVAAALLRGESISLDPTRRVSPTSATSLARCVADLLGCPGRRDPGVVHFQCSGTTTWYAWGTTLLDRLHNYIAREDERVERLLEAQLQMKDPIYRAPRPNAQLACDKYVWPPSWQEALDEYAQEVLA